MLVAAELFLMQKFFEDTAKSANETTKDGCKIKASIPIPWFYSEAINNPVYSSKWCEAIHLELQNLLAFGTWHVIKKPALDGTHIVSCHWVFDIKTGPDSQIECFKAHLVAQGFSQEYRCDYEATFSPVMRLETLQTLLALAVMFRMIAHLLDATNVVFLIVLSYFIVIQFM